MINLSLNSPRFHLNTPAHNMEEKPIMLVYIYGREIKIKQSVHELPYPQIVEEKLLS